MRNILTFDVEDWGETMLELLDIPVSRPTYPREEVVWQTQEVLNILRERGVEATFFVLGTVAEKYPALVRAISQDGHEVASHGYRHRLLTKQTPEALHLDVGRSLAALKDATQQEVVGYRAPFFSVTERSMWALDVVAGHGLRYDSSIFPINRPLYGIASAERFIHQESTRNDLSVTEVPLSTLRFLSTNVPVAGGGYFRLAPYAFTRWAIRRINQRGRPAVVYIHPHDLFQVTELPAEIQERGRQRGSVVGETLVRLQGLGRRRGKEKLAALLGEFEFCSIRTSLGV